MYKVKNRILAGFDLSMKQRILMIVGLFILVNLLLLGLSYLQADTMNSVRSYVRGEGLWAKAQKDSVFHIQNYIRSGEEKDYQKYMNALTVPLGDRQARLTLQSSNPDYDLAFKGFLAGQNDAQDIMGMIRFFIRFQHFPYMSDAIAVWTKADALISQLQQLGQQIHNVQQVNDNNKISSLLDELDALNWQLAEQENEFSRVLSEGSRWVRNVLMWASLGLFGAMFFVVMLVSRRIIKGIEKTENDLSVSENRFISLYHSNVLGIIDWHGDGSILDANDAFLNMLGYTQEDVRNGKLNWRDLTPAEGHSRDNIALAEIEMKGYCNPFEKELIHHDGSMVPVYIGAALLSGEREKGISFIVDQTEQKRAYTEIQLSAKVFDASSDGIMITDKDKKIIAVNRAWCNMSGYTQEEAQLQSASLLRSNKMPDPFYSEMWDSLNKTDCWQGDILNNRKDGSELTVRLSINAVRDDMHQIKYFVAIYTDISVRKANEEQLRKMAHYDFLTGLANRSLFTDQLRTAIQRAKRHSSVFAVLFVDIDHFKPVNDEYGHEIGDKLLQEIAERLKKVVRGNDVVARLGGDEFVILLEDLSEPKAASQVATKVIDVINHTCVIEPYSFQVGSSVGISFFPDDGEDTRSILNAADIAMYAAKEAGRNRYFYFNRGKKCKQ